MQAASSRTLDKRFIANFLQLVKISCWIRARGTFRSQPSQETRSTLLENPTIILELKEINHKINSKRWQLAIIRPISWCLATDSFRRQRNKQAQTSTKLDRLRAHLSSTYWCRVRLLTFLKIGWHRSREWINEQLEVYNLLKFNKAKLTKLKTRKIISYLKQLKPKINKKRTRRTTCQTKRQAWLLLHTSSLWKTSLA